MTFQVRFSNTGRLNDLAHDVLRLQVDSCLITEREWKLELERRVGVPPWPGWRCKRGLTFGLEKNKKMYKEYLKYGESYVLHQARTLVRVFRAIAGNRETLLPQKFCPYIVLFAIFILFNTFEYKIR